MITGGLCYISWVAHPSSGSYCIECVKPYGYPGTRTGSIQCLDKCLPTIYLNFAYKPWKIYF